MSQPPPAAHAPRVPLAPEGRWLSQWFTAARREGLLTALTPEQWHTLSAVLSFRSQEGRLTFGADQLAVVLGQPRTEALSRLQSLAAVRWRDAFLVRPEYYLNGDLSGATVAALELFARLGEPVGVTAVTAAAAAATSNATAPDLGPALEEVGLTGGQIDWLLAHFDAERIQRQLAWLPERAARNPAALLIRAVEDDWEPPRPAIHSEAGNSASAPELASGKAAE